LTPSDFIYVETTENEIGKMPLNWFLSLFNSSKEALDKLNFGRAIPGYIGKV